MICRITDLDVVREILTCPDIYPAIGDDYTPPVEEFRVNPDAAIWYLGVHDRSGLYGMFTLMPQNRVCWEVHVVMLPCARTRMKWTAAKELPGWLAENTECRRLTAAVPSSNWPAVIYGTHGIGMRYAGRHDKAFMRGGKLEDLILLGMPIGKGCRGYLPGAGIQPEAPHHAEKHAV